MTRFLFLFSCLTMIGISTQAKIAKEDILNKHKGPSYCEDKDLRQSRLAQARQLLGRYYKRSVVKVGEKVKNINTFVYDRLKQNLRERKWTGSVKKIYKTILKQSETYGYDPLFLMAVIENESSFNTKAKGHFGEIGLMQIKPDTAEWISHKYKLKWKGKKSLFDPVTNIRIGAAYLDFLRERFENHSRLYLAAYNMGSTNVHLALDNGVWPKDYPVKVMEHYIDMYRKLRELMEADNKSGIQVAKKS